jgi:hypothetical protein
MNIVTVCNITTVVALLCPVGSDTKLRFVPFFLSEEVNPTLLLLGLFRVHAPKPPVI